MTLFYAQMYFTYHGEKNPGVHPSRWRAMLAQIKKDEK